VVSFQEERLKIVPYEIGYANLRSSWRSRISVDLSFSCSTSSVAILSTRSNLCEPASIPSWNSPNLFWISCSRHNR